MTLEEKLGQLTQFTPGKKDLPALIAQGRVGSVFGTGTSDDVNALQRVAVEQSRTKIPILFGHDVIHGWRTIFPIPPAIASSWDPRMAELAARIAAREARSAGLRWTFAPMVDIARDPRWGRIAEGAGEDPFLGSAMAAAQVRGFQGSDVLACAKHYVAYGAAEGGRDYNSTDMSERMLRQVYLPPFKAAVDAGVGTLMSAFNALNGVPTTANRHTLSDILRGEWKFEGFVVSDYDAVVQLIPHGVAATAQEAAIKAISAGVDMNMVDDSYITLAEAVRSGKISQSVIDTAVRRVLRAKIRVGLFTDPYTDSSREAAAMLTKENLDAARQVAQKSIVLLKNDGPLLPLSKTARTIAVVGPLGDSQEDMLGPWSALGKKEDAVSVLEGLRAKVSPATRLLKATGEDISAAVAAANEADVTLAVLGEARGMSGEAASRVSLDLPGSQQQLLESLVATGKPVVLVVMSGRPLTIGWAAEHVPSIVWAWYLGSQSGHALADVLFGDVNPSGKLPVTFPRSVGQIPIYHAHLRTGRPPEPDDKYTSKYLDSPNEPLFPFGFGLSYTKFAYRNLTIEGMTASAEIQNVGDRAGEEIAQFYIGDPVASVARPVKELRGFEKVALGPGETKRVSFTIQRDALAFWSDSGWKVEPGTFKVWIGPSSAEGLEGSFELGQ